MGNLSVRECQETGREDAHTLKDNTIVSRVNRILSTSESDMDSYEIEEVMQTLKVMKLHKQGRYSSRYKAKPNKGPCRKCSTEHPVGRCPANSKTCFGCGDINHFSRAPSCPKRSDKKIQEDPTNLGYEEQCTPISLTFKLLGGQVYSTQSSIQQS